MMTDDSNEVDPNEDEVDPIIIDLQMMTPMR